jgi:two-component system chemotaxis sensor kinase CheA
MPIPPESLQALDDSIGRLAAESILAQSGRDDGLVPSYSLLGDLSELCAGEPGLHAPVAALHAELERMLDSAQPFDDLKLGRLRALVEWLPVALECMKESRAVPPFDAVAPAASRA